MESDSRSVRLHPLVRDFAQKKVPAPKKELFRAKAAENSLTAYFDYPRLENELKARGVDEVLSDLQIAVDWWGNDAQALQELRLIKSTLGLSINQLVRDSQHLAPQLIGRLRNINTPRITKLLVDASKSQNGVWFNPICCSLTPPGGPLQRTYEGHRGEVYLVAIAPDGKTALSGSDDKTLKLWDLPSGKTLHTLEGHRGGVYAVAISPDGRIAVSGSADRTLKLWDLSSGKALHTLEGHSDMINAVAISPDGKTAVSGSNDNTLKLWDLSSGKALHTLKLKGYSHWLGLVAISPDGKTAVSGSWDRTLELWDLFTGEFMASFVGDSDIASLAISSCGRVVLAGDGNGHVHFLRLEGVE
jgi:WD40 repeat protein